MACVDPDGTLMPSAIAILQALKTPLTVEELVKVVDQPMFKVRSGLREMVSANLVELIGDKYKATAEGLARLK